MKKAIALAAVTVLLSGAIGFGGGWLAASLNQPTVKATDVTGCWDYTIPNRSTGTGQAAVICLEGKR